MNKFCGIYKEKINKENHDVITHEFIGMFNPYNVNKNYNDYVDIILKNLLYYELEEHELFNIYVTEEIYNGYYECLYGMFINSDGDIEIYSKNDGEDNE